MEERKSVLILGAGLMQRPALISAKELGFYTYVIDANDKAESIPYADEFKQVDLKDREGILALASELKEKCGLKAIFTAGTDFSASVSYASEKLNLPAHSFNAALNASIKPRMRECFKKAGVPSPVFYSLCGEEISEEKVHFITEALGYPCVVKPADNMGARGCRMIRSFSEAMNSVRCAAENSRTGTVIIEEYMAGPEYSIDALVYNGTMTITGFADRHIYYPPYFIETGHTMPTVVKESVKLELISAFARGVKALGLTCGAAKADIKYTARGPQIGEIAARLSGGYMSGWTFPYASGLNLTEQALLIAAGNVPEELLRNRFPLPPDDSGFALFQIPCAQVSAERAWISIPGKIKSIEGLDAAKNIDGVMNVFPRPVKAGDEIDFPRNNVQKCGNVISRNEDYHKAVMASEKACSKILIRLEPDNDRTEKFLAGISKDDEKGFPPCAFDAYEKLSSLELSGTIPENQPVLKFVTPELEELLSSPQKDWNYLTALETAARFDLLVPVHKALNKSRFWRALLKGGLQAAIYVSDSN